MSSNERPGLVCCRPGCTLPTLDDEVFVSGQFLADLASEVVSLSQAIDAVAAAWLGCLGGAEPESFDWWEAYSRIRWAAAPVIRAAHMLFPLPDPAGPALLREPREEGGHW